MLYKEIANLLTIQGGGIPLTRSSRRLVANETKKYLFDSVKRVMITRFL